MDEIILTPEEEPEAERIEEIVQAGSLGVVVDVRMPGLGGLKLQKRLIRARVTVPLVVMSGYAGTRTIVQSRRRGAITFLDKPSSTMNCTARSNRPWPAIANCVTLPRAAEKSLTALPVLRRTSGTSWI